VTAIRSVVLGCGSYLPQKVLTNAELAARIDTSDEWIVQRTGIRQRHIAADGEFTSHLAINAARAALADAGIDAQSIDLIVLGTSTPDNTFPATAQPSTCRQCVPASSSRLRQPTISCAAAPSSAPW
jgi:3-oxoacyl-[acyl-carrier-protein] synthase-3